jgi:HSP20 family protein
MEPLRTLVGRAWDSLTEGWRELLARSSGALTHFGAGEDRAVEPGQEPASWSLLAAETWETARSVVIRLEVPGMRKDDLSVAIHGHHLAIRGEKRADPSLQGRRYHLAERAFGRFERTIPLPHGVDAAHAETTYRDGVLTVIVPKTEDVPPRPLTISD